MSKINCECVQAPLLKKPILIGYSFLSSSTPINNANKILTANIGKLSIADESAPKKNKGVEMKNNAEKIPSNTFDKEPILYTR